MARSPAKTGDATAQGWAFWELRGAARLKAVAIRTSDMPSGPVWWSLGRTNMGDAFPAPRAAYLGRLRMSAIWVGAQPYMRASGLALSTLRDRRL